MSTNHLRFIILSGVLSLNGFLFGASHEELQPYLEQTTVPRVKVRAVATIQDPNDKQPSKREITAYYFGDTIVLDIRDRLGRVVTKYHPDTTATQAWVNFAPSELVPNPQFLTLFYSTHNPYHYYAYARRKLLANQDAVKLESSGSITHISLPEPATGADAGFFLDGQLSFSFDSKRLVEIRRSFPTKEHPDQTVDVLNVHFSGFEPWSFGLPTKVQIRLSNHFEAANIQIQHIEPLSPNISANGILPSLTKGLTFLNDQTYRTFRHRYRNVYSVNLWVVGLGVLLGAVIVIRVITLKRK